MAFLFSNLLRLYLLFNIKQLKNEILMFTSSVVKTKYILNSKVFILHIVQYLMFK